MKAIGKRILIDPKPIEKVTKGGIILQSKVEEKPSVGKVLSVGGDVKEIKIGDIIHFNKHVAVEIVVDDIKYLTVKEEEAYTVE